MVRIADELYTWRVTFRLSQQAAADLANVTVRTWGRWERGESYPAEDHYNDLRWLIAQPPPSWVAREPVPARTDLGEERTEEGVEHDLPAGGRAEA